MHGPGPRSFLYCPAGQPTHASPVYPSRHRYGQIGVLCRFAGASAYARTWDTNTHTHTLRRNATSRLSELGFVVARGALTLAMGRAAGIGSCGVWNLLGRKSALRGLVLTHKVQPPAAASA